MTVHIDNWGADYGAAYQVVDGGAAGDGAPGEDGDRLAAHRCTRPHPEDRRLAFVDRVRRVDASLSWDDGATGATIRGIAGSHGVGSVLVDGISRPVIGETRITRLLLWNGDHPHDLPGARGGYSWSARCTASDQPDAPLQRLQELMREAEGALAERLCEQGWTVVVDGPLNFVRSRECTVVGYAKTLHRQYLQLAEHRRVPTLREGERSSLFRIRRDVYACYLRLAGPTPISGPWHGIVRLEVPDARGLDAAIATLDRAGGLLPRYAGVGWRDPRAPQQLQPVAALETRLRHLLGDPHLTTRAVREAVSALTR